MQLYEKVKTEKKRLIHKYLDIYPYKNNNIIIYLLYIKIYRLYLVIFKFYFIVF